MWEQPARARVRALPAALPLLALALAGCTVEPPQLQLPPGDRALGGLGAGAGSDALNATFDAPPPWELRQWWRFRSPNGLETRAVAGDGGGSWLVGTDSEQAAYFEARFDISTVGPIRKADLAGAQRGAAVEYYRWPLVENLTWTTTWDGAARTVRVLGPTTATIAGRTYPAMALEAVEGTRVAVRYDFVPAAGWMSRAEFIGPEGPTFALALAEFGREFNGTLVTASLHEVHREDKQGPLTPAAQFQVPEGLAYLDVQVRLAGDAAAYQLAFRGPDGFQATHQLGPCTANCSLDFNTTLPAVPGAWSLAALGGVQGQAVKPQAHLGITGVQFHRRAAG